MLKKIGKILLVIIALLLCCVILLAVYISTPYFTASLGTYLTHSTGRNVQMEGSIEMHVWSTEPRFIFRNVKIGNAEWAKNPAMFEAQKIDVSVRLWPLFLGRVELPELIADRPIINLEKNEKGEANWELGSNPQAAIVKQPVPQSRATVPAIGLLQISEGELHYHDPVQKISTDLKTSSVEGEAGKGKDSIHFDGKGSYQGQPFALNFTGASVLQLTEDNRPYPFSFKTDIGNTHASMKGSVQDPVKLEALDVTLTIEGANAADLFLVTHIALPPTPHYKVTGHLVRKGDEWDFKDFAGSLGNSDLKGALTWLAPAKTKPKLEGQFISDNLDMRDLAGLIGADKKPADNDRIIPDTPLDISRVMAMDADVTFHGSHIKLPSMLEDFLMHIVLIDGSLFLKPLTFTIAKGKIDVALTIEGKQTPPHVTGDINFEHLSINSIFAPLAKSFGEKNVQAGLFGGKFSFDGHGKSLQEILANANGSLGLGMEGGQLSHLLLDLAGLDLLRSAGLVVGGDAPSPIHCVVTDFDITDGIMKTQAFLIDTDVSAVTAEGTASLKDETMDLTMRAHPKEASLLSMRAPIHMYGRFKKPSISPDTTTLIIRGGAATALGLLAPPAALLAFVEPGLGADGQCAAVIKQMKNDTDAVPPQGKDPSKPDIVAKPAKQP